MWTGKDLGDMGVTGGFCGSLSGSNKACCRSTHIGQPLRGLAAKSMSRLFARLQTTAKQAGGKPIATPPTSSEDSGWRIYIMGGNVYY